MKKSWNIIVENQTKYKVKKLEVKKLIKNILNELKNHCEIKDFLNEVSISFVNDDFIRELNRTYREKDSPTDVLSFANLDNDDNNFVFNSLGDIVVSLDTAKKQAIEYETTFNNEIIRLLVHGMLHLNRFEHENVPDKVKKVMFDLQDDIISKNLDLIFIVND